MAISAPHYAALKELASRNELPVGGRILEIGEANLYDGELVGDIDKDIQSLPEDPRKESLFKRLSEANRGVFTGNNYAAWDHVKIIYDLFMQPSEVRSIDMHGTPAAQKMNLNLPMKAPEPFDLVVNHGTAEHIFHVANVFKVMHDAVKVGGLMIHESPCTGWFDHGFYCLQPTLFYDLAATNNYDIRYMAIEHVESKLLQPVANREQFHLLAKHGKIPNNAMLYVAMRKTKAAEFLVPMQGVYSNGVSRETMEAWHSLR